jgi:hypothetical protein
VSGAPRLHVLYQEVGLKESETAGVGGGTPTRFGGFQPSPLDRVQGRTFYFWCGHSVDPTRVDGFDIPLQLHLPCVPRSMRVRQGSATTLEFGG